jgi:hypothetical protein
MVFDLWKADECRCDQRRSDIDRVTRARADQYEGSR